MLRNSDLRSIQTSTSFGAGRYKLLFLIGIKLLLVAAVVLFTNQGFLDRVKLLLVNHRYDTLVPYVAIWGISGLALAIAVLQPERWARLFWALIIAFSTAVGWGYHQASQSELTAFDVISLWNARHEAGRAGEQYAQFVWMGLGLFAIAFVLMGAGPAAWGERSKRWLKRLLWVPALPVAAIAGIVYLKGGGGSQSMPQQFAPLAVTGVTAVRIALNPPQPRREVAWVPDSNARQEKILVLVDESIRADYTSLEPGNPLTPNLAKSSTHLIDYGRTISGGNCSHYSNAILRFLVDRDNIIQSANTNPTIWDYAHKAGYRTVFVDAQAGSIRTASALQNFMTLEEKGKIDSFHAIQDVPAQEADERLMGIVAEELAKPGPVLIYATKNGAHFPYDESYPQESAKFHPTVTETGETFEGRAGSYMNAIAWSVDRLWPRLMESVISTKATMIYTSDHGQIVEPVGLTHCHVTDPETRTALVPMMLYIPEGASRDRYASAAITLKDKASHFMIPATLLSFMGYSETDVMGTYNMSLLNAGNLPLVFTSGDIFGLMSDDVAINPANPMSVNMEAAAAKALSGQAKSASVQ